MSRLYFPIAGSVNKYASPDSWEHVRPLITRLYVDEDRTLSEVMTILARDRNHRGTIKQYKGRIKKWGLDKNHKEIEMHAIVHQKRQRDAIGKASAFSVRGRPVTAAEVLEYFRRKRMLDPEAEAGFVDIMPEAVRCWTPSPGEEPQSEELDSSLKDFNERPRESSHMDYFSTMELEPPTRADAQQPPTFTINQMRRLLSLSPEITTFEMPCSLLPPQTLLTPERLLFHVKAYFVGSFRNGTFISNNQGILDHVSESLEARKRLQNFSDLGMTAGYLMQKGLCVEGRRVLSKACVLVKDIIQDQHPRVLNYIISIVLNMSNKNFPDLGTHLLSYISEMAAHLLHPSHPWGQILLLIGTPQGSHLQPLLQEVWSCIFDTFQTTLGDLHLDVLTCIGFPVGIVHEPNTAGKIFPSLLEKAEQEIGGFDMRIMYLQYRYGDYLYQQGQYAEAIKVIQKVLKVSFVSFNALVLLAWCNYKLGHMIEAEMNIRESIVCFDRTGRLTLNSKNTLCAWLREWGRVEESESLKAEIRKLTEWEGIDEI